MDTGISLGMERVLRSKVKLNYLFAKTNNL
jgi:hypothetical protein